LIRILVIVLTTALPACVIPLGPDFTDPPAAQNLPPHIVSANPDQGMLVTVPTTFRVWVTDPNPGDTLYDRWYADFPPLQANTRPIVGDFPTVQPRADGAVQTFQLQAEIDCNSLLAPGIDQHTVTVVISDLAAPGPTTPFDGNHEVVATWSLLLQCRMSPTGP
jgi:hypothetical protein